MRRAAEGRRGQAPSNVAGSGPRRRSSFSALMAARSSVVQAEVEDLDVLLDPRRRHGLRDHHVAQLEVPAQHDLGRCAAVLPGDGHDRRDLQQALALAERRPGLGGDALLRVVLTGGVLLQVRVQLDLVDRRDDRRLADQPLQVLGKEVGDTDGPDPAVGVQLLERLVRVDVRAPGRQRPVDQVEVDVVQAELLQRRVEGAQRGVVPLVAVPELGGDEEFLAGEPGGGDGLAGALLVAVDRRCVDAAVPGLQCRRDGRLGLVVRHLPDAEAQLGHLDAVVEDDRGDLAAHELSILRFVVRWYSHRQRSRAVMHS